MYVKGKGCYFVIQEHPNRYKAFSVSDVLPLNMIGNLIRNTLC